MYEWTSDKLNGSGIFLIISDIDVSIRSWISCYVIWFVASDDISDFKLVIAASICNWISLNVNDCLTLDIAASTHVCISSNVIECGIFEIDVSICSWIVSNEIVGGILDIALSIISWISSLDIWEDWLCGNFEIISSIDNLRFDDNLSFNNSSILPMLWTRGKIP